jgi:biopolymer transport protein ExbD
MNDIDILPFVVVVLVLLLLLVAVVIVLVSQHAESSHTSMRGSAAAGRCRV